MGQGTIHTPSWSPDSKRVTFMRNSNRSAMDQAIRRVNHSPLTEAINRRSFLSAGVWAISKLFFKINQAPSLNR